MNDIFLLICCFFGAIIDGQLQDAVSLVNTGVWEQRGFYRRELSLVKPYQGAGMEIPYWDVTGSTIVTQQAIRLTLDERSKRGALWNQVPVPSRDWEMHVTFRVTGSKGDLYGDGMAIWYTQNRMELGPVFGSRDLFKGLAIFLDTYSNHNGPHGHGHPYISAMVNNGTASYDHDNDGTHSQLGGEHTGCESKFRNKDHDANLLVRYVADTLTVYTDVFNKGAWVKCFSANGVRLPTGYYLGFSAATGDLSDAHDIVSVRFYEIEFNRNDSPYGEAVNFEPSAEYQAAPRDHVTTPPPSKLGWFGTILLVIVGVIVVGGALGFGYNFLQQRSLHQRKRFY